MQKCNLFGCSQTLPVICFLLHPNRLNISKIIPQNVNDHVYYTEAESSHFLQWLMCLLRMGVDVGVSVWVRRGALWVYVGVSLPNRHRHIATLTYQHHAATIPTPPHPHSTSTHLTTNVQTFAHHPIFRNFPFIHFWCWDINWYNFVKIWSILVQ